MKKTSLLIVIFLVGYLSTHLYGLTRLPIFADEAIYIRWSQLIIDDWQQYLFFSLNDGKTPLLIWLQVPMLRMFADPLFAVRLLSVGVGLAQAAVLYGFTRTLGGGRMSAWLSAICVAILPFWYFHHRMGLIDGMLTLWLSLTLWMVWRAFRHISTHKPASSVRRILLDKKILVPVVLASTSFGAALWTKLPAMLLLPSLGVLALVAARNSRARIANVTVAAFVVLAGYTLFFVQALHPAFPQLFSRGSDFLFPVSELLAGNVLQHTLPSIPNYANYFVAYATAPFWILLIIGLFYGRHKLAVHQLFWLGLLFVLPMFVLGRVVYPRYLLPAMLFFTPAASLAIEGLVQGLDQRNLKPLTVLSLVSVVLLCANIVNFSVRFMTPAMFNADQIPFVSADAEQYLEEWSSGHGIVETVNLIQKAAQTKRIAIATEGYFGTLPDAILVYFHNQSVENISVEGIGQPVQEIPDEFMQKHSDADERWLVVNSHRLMLESPGTLLAEYCRPNAAPCLQVWKFDE